jgi:uncharacterized protein YjbJ (UPF0337 family)
LIRAHTAKVPCVFAFKRLGWFQARPNRLALPATIQERTRMMNKDQVEGKWEQLKGKAKEKWGKLTDDDWKVAEGKRDQIAGKIQEHYGYTKEQAEKEFDDWINKN